MNITIFNDPRFEFDFFGDDVRVAVDWVVAQSNGLKQMLASPNEIPEGQVELDLKSRNGDKSRMMKHIHQQSFFKLCHFKTRSLFKLIYLVDGYFQMLEVKNPVGIFSFARSMLEFNAHIFDVHSRLTRASDQSLDWRSRGEKFHKTINRARLGTSNPYAKELYEEAGMSKSISDPVHIHKSIESLSSVEEFTDIKKRYGFLCDFVHHNRSSQAILSGELLRKTSAKFSKSTIIFPSGEARDINRYEFPPKSVTEDSFDYVTLDFTRDFAGGYIAIQLLPESPFTMAELEKETGSPVGTPVASQSSNANRPREKVSRNADCPCGSGKKYKKCCLRK